MARVKESKPEEIVCEVVIKDKYDVLHLPTVMVNVGGESRIERIKKAINSVGEIKGIFEFKGDVYIAVEK